MKWEILLFFKIPINYLFPVFLKKIEINTRCAKSCTNEKFATEFRLATSITLVTCIANYFHVASFSKGFTYSAVGQ